MSRFRVVGWSVCGNLPSKFLGVIGGEGSAHEAGEPGVDGRNRGELDDDGDWNIHARLDEKSDQGGPYDDLSSHEPARLRAKTISEVEPESLLQRDCNTKPSEVGIGEIALVLSDVPSSLSTSMPASQGQRAMLPSKTTSVE